MTTPKLPRPPEIMTPYNTLLMVPSPKLIPVLTVSVDGELTAWTEVRVDDTAKRGPKLAATTPVVAYGRDWIDLAAQTYDLYPTLPPEVLDGPAASSVAFSAGWVAEGQGVPPALSLEPLTAGSADVARRAFRVAFAYVAKARALIPSPAPPLPDYDNDSEEG
jgi:hypothetical protein